MPLKAPGTGVPWDLDTCRMLLSLANMHRLHGELGHAQNCIFIACKCKLQIPTAVISTQCHGHEPQRWSNILWGAAGCCKTYVLLKIRASKGRWKHKPKIVRIGLRTLDFLWGRRPGSVAGPWGKEEVAGGLAVSLTCCHAFGNSFFLP